MMWPNSRCIQVHIPKTAGNSIRSALQAAWQSTPPLQRLVFRTRHGGRGPVRTVRGAHKHAKAWDLRTSLGEETWSRCFSFAFVRNPWDLMVSSYTWWLEKAERWEKLRPSAQEIKALGSFPRFIESNYGREMINEHQGNIRDWLCGPDGETVVDVVGQFEHLERDWAQIVERLGVKAPLPHLNRGKRGPYASYYDDTSRTIVAERFAWTIERFGYRF